NKAVYRRMVEEVVNQGKFDVVDEIFHPDYIDHTAPPGAPGGLDGVKAIFAMFRSGFPDVKFTIRDMVGEGEFVATLVHGEGTNASNLDVYDELVTDDFVDHQAVPGLPPGREGFKALNAMFRSAFPDVWVTVDRILVDGDKVACRWTSTGTHQGDLFGIPPT